MQAVDNISKANEGNKQMSGEKVFKSCPSLVEYLAPNDFFSSRYNHQVLGNVLMLGEVTRT